MLANMQLLQSGAFIQGHWIQTASTYSVVNPSDKQPIQDVSCCAESETLQAITAASNALAAWKKTTAQARASVLKLWAELMLANKSDLARLMTLEQGKPLIEAEGEVHYAASFLTWFAEESRRVYGELVPSHQVNSRILVTKQPVGVVAAITPWNFPLAMITRKAGAALAAGCTMIIKPSEETPLSAMALMVLAKEAGIPDGVVNLVSGDAQAIGSTLLAAEEVRKISFTGSTRVGQILMEQAATHVKKLSLELGGNAPFIVFEDADLDAAVEGAIASKFRNAGQTCVCANRFYIHRSVFSEFMSRFQHAIEQLTVGNGIDESVTIGPLINEPAIQKVERHVEDALSKGAQLICGGSRHNAGDSFYTPTLLSAVTHQMLITQEETFGPVAACIMFEQESEVIDWANDTPFGLAAYFYSQNLARVWRVSEALETGIVGVNEGIISTEVAPFGGIKMSGLEREGAHQGIEPYLDIKYVLMGGLN